MQMALLAVSMYLLYNCIDNLSHFPSASKILIPSLTFSFQYDVRIVMVPSYYHGSHIIISVIFATLLPRVCVLHICCKLILKEGRVYTKQMCSWLIRWLSERGSGQ